MTPMDRLLSAIESDQQDCRTERGTVPICLTESLLRPPSPDRYERPTAYCPICGQRSLVRGVCELGCVDGPEVRS